MLAVIGKKIDQTQRFLEDGTRIPVTRINVPGNVVLDIKTQAKNKYTAVALGFGANTKNHKKSSIGLAKKAKLQHPPQLIKEIKQANENDLPEIGTLIKVEEVFTPGDIIQVSGMSKGKGFAGGVKRHHFSGGPKTHGQSDRHRAPGSIGQGTTPGRVFKGKRMAGHMGHENVTVSNLNVVAIEGETLLVAGLVPGPANNMLVLTKTGELGKKFVPLTKTKEQLDEEAKQLAEEQKRQAEEAEALAKTQAVEAEALANSQAEAEKSTPIEEVVTSEPQEEKAEEAVVSPVEEAVAEQEVVTNDATPVEDADAKEVKEDENGTK